MVGTAGVVGIRLRLVQVQPRCAHTCTCTQTGAGPHAPRPLTLSSLASISTTSVSTSSIVALQWEQGGRGQPAASQPDLTSGWVFASPCTPRGAAGLMAACRCLLTCAPRPTGRPRNGSWEKLLQPPLPSSSPGREVRQVWGQRKGLEPQCRCILGVGTRQASHPPAQPQGPDGQSHPSLVAPAENFSQSEPRAPDGGSL